jgi:SAM-dependent methyltransferase
VEAATSKERDAQWAKLAYEAIAPVYDDFTAHHDYEVWLGNLLPQLERLGLRGNRLLDVGCGTGKSFLPMLDRGWEVTACDISESMLSIARKKTGDRVRLSAADMRELPVFGEFDLVWCLDDAVNYLLSGEELERALSGMCANLAPHGLLMFDVNTLLSYRTFFAEEEVVESKGRRLIWRGMTPPDASPGSICEASFGVESGEDDELGEVKTELHRERHFPEAEILEALESASLECLEIFGHDTDAVLEQPLEDLRHSKGIFIARRA